MSVMCKICNDETDESHDRWPNFCDECDPVVEIGRLKKELEDTRGLLLSQGDGEALKKSDGIGKSIDLIIENGMIDGAHHKQWLIDQTLRSLLGDCYDGWIAENKWDQGVAP